MRPKKWQCKLLAGILCASLVFQNLSVTANATEADEATQITVEQTQEDSTVVEERDTVETEQAAEEPNEETINEEESIVETSEEAFTEAVTDEQLSETSETATTEAVSKEETTETASTEEATTEEVTEEETTEEEATEEETTEEEVTTEEETIEETMTEDMLFAASEIGSFEDIEIEYSGFYGSVSEGKVIINEADEEYQLKLYAVQYDKKDKKVESKSLTSFNGTSEQKYVFDYEPLSFPVDNKASYVRLEVYSGNKVAFVSDKFTIGERPDVSFKVDKYVVESGSVDLTISYDGDLRLKENDGEYLSVRLDYGTSKDESKWKSASKLIYQLTGETNDVRFSGLNSGQKYYGKLTIYQEYYNNIDYTYHRVFEQVISLDSFTTKTGQNYNLQTTFPDPGLRDLVRRYAGIWEGEEVSSAELEKITTINAQNMDALVKDLTGIELLTGLKYLYMQYQEIDDISKIDWSKLTYLESLELQGNNITSIPDLKNTKLKHIVLDENKLSDKVLSTAYSKLPVGVIFSCRNQRADGLKLELDDEYYVYASGSVIYTKVTGFKTNLPYTIRFYVDGKETAFEAEYYYDHIYSLKNADLKVGKHKIKAELLLNGEVAEKSPEYTFNIVDEKLFAEKEPYYYDATNSNDGYCFTVYTVSNKSISRMSMINDAGKVYAETKDAVYLYMGWNDPRLTVYQNVPTGSLYMTSEFLTTKYNVTPAGLYDVKLEYTDGTSDILEDVIHITGTKEVTILDCSIGYDYDNTGDYIYLSLEGSNIDPSKLEYTFTQNGENYPVTYVNHKNVYSGVIVKLKKNDWAILNDNHLNVKITGKSGYTVISGDYFASVYISTGIYYCEYNMITGQMEVAFCTSLQSNNKPVTISLREDWDDDSPVIAYGSATVKDGFAYFDLKNPDGTPYVPTQSGSIYITCTLMGRNYENNTYINVHSSSTNYWNASQPVIEGTKTVTHWFHSGIPYSETNADGKLYRAEITADNLATPVTTNDIWTYESDGYVNMIMSFDISRLKAGTYMVTVYKNKEALSSTTFKIMEAERFILDYVSASWASKSEISLYVSTPYTRDNDEYEITFTDPDGNAVTGLTIKETNRYDTVIYFSITGLKYEDATKYYYIKIKHKTLGEPYTTTEQLYYSDEKGKLTNIYHSGMSYVSMSNNRLICVGMSNAEFPVKIKVYKPYDTDVIKEITVNSTSDLTDGYYYFTKELYDSLPNKDSAYHVIIIENNKRVNTTTRVLGYREMAQEEKVWSVSIDKANLFLNVDEEKTATITVSDNKKAPIFKSSDTSVVTVTADKEDPSKAVVTAVGLGMAQISITADGITKTFDVTVDRKIVLEELVLNKTELTLGIGNSCKLTASVRPMEAWTEESKITFTSSDETVVAIADGASEEIATITALKVGTATITATLDGTDYKATCTVTVTGVYTPDEQANKVQEAGTAYVLLNAFDKNTATLADVDLPDGWSWVDDTEKLAADNAAPVQKYMACYESKGYEAFTALLPVAVSQLTGISITGKTNILTGTDATSEIVLKYTGYQPTAGEFDKNLTYKWTAAGKAPIVTVKTPSAKKTVITADKEITKSTSQVVNVEVIVNGDAKKNFKSALKLTVSPEPYVDSITVKKASEQLGTEVANEFKSNVLKVDYAKISTANNTVRLEATAFTGKSETVLPKGLKWTSSDSSVVTVKAEKDSRFAVVTVKKAGSAAIQVTSTDNGKFVQEIEVNVTDYAPIIDNRNITVSMYSTAGTVLPVIAQNGNAITDVNVMENGAESEKLTVTKNGNRFILKLKEGYTATKNQTVKAVLKITTNAGTYDDSKAQAVNITIDVKKPTASVKLQAKANLFYKLCLAAYTVSSKYEIASIEDVTGGTATRFKASYNKDLGVVYFTPDLSLTSETLAAFKDKNSAACKVKLKINFVGYSEEASQIINVTVATEEKKPSWKLDDLILMPGVTSGVVEVRDAKTKQAVDLSDMKDVTVTSDNSKTYDVTTVKSADKVTVTYAGDKSATYKAQITSDWWTSAVTADGKITVATNQNLVLSSSKITLNTAHNIQENGKLAIDVSVKNHSGAIQGLKYQIDKKNATLFNNGLAITYSAQKQQMYVGLNQGNFGNIKPGSYKINLIGTVLVGGKEVEIKPATLTVTIVNKSVTVSMKAKGSIDLVRRNTTSIVYTPNLSNVTAKVESVKLTGSYAGYFTASVEDGTVVLKATNQPMSTKLTYPVTMELTLDNDCTVTTTVKVKPVNKTPKLVAELTQKTLYKSSTETASFKVTSKSADTKIESITHVEDKNSKYFKFTYDKASQTVSVSLTDAARKLKPGKYTISYQVKMEGEAYNVKPTTMKLTVTVK